MCGMDGSVTVTDVLGFAPTLRFLWCQVLGRLYENHSDETINPAKSHACTHMHRDHIQVYINKIL